MNNKKKGIICIIIAAFCFALMSFFIRMSGDLPTMQKGFFRNVVAMAVATIVILKNDRDFHIEKSNIPLLFARAIGGTVGLVCNFYAIDHMNISDANMLNKLSPFFAIVMSTFILNEIATRKEWALVFMAFIGAIFVIKPSFNIHTYPALIATLGGLAAGTAYTFLRKLGLRNVKGSIIILFFSTFSCLFTLPFFIINYKPMTKMQLLFLILTGISAAGGQFFITKAYSNAPAKEISIYDYSQVIFAAILGFIFLNQKPDLLSIIGYVVIISAAVLKWLHLNKSLD